MSLGGFSGGKVSLASTQASVFELGNIDTGANATFYVYFRTTDSDDGTPATAFTAKIWTARPLTHSSPGPAATLSLSVVVADTISANSNKINSVALSSSLLVVGSPFTLTSYGNAGTIGSSGSVSFSPSANPSWPAGVFQLTGFSVNWTDSSTGQQVFVRDRLTLPTSAASSLSGQNYQADFTFIPARIVKSTIVEPVVYIASGNVQKHSAPPAAQLNVIPKPENYARVRMTAGPLFLPGGGVMAVTLAVSSIAPIDTKLSALLLNVSDGFTVLPSTFRASARSPITTAPVTGPSSIGWSSITLPALTSWNVTFNISVASYTAQFFSGYGLIFSGVVDSTLDMSVRCSCLA